MTHTATLPDPTLARDYFEAKMAFTTGPIELHHALNEGNAPTIIDVRAADDFAKGHLPGAINLPEGEWDSPRGLSKDGLNVLYCYSQVCHLAAKAAVQFSRDGFAVQELEGGFAAWQAHDLPIET